MANFNTIVLRGVDNRRVAEFTAGVAINPGYLCKLYNSTVLKVKPNDVAGSVKTSKWFALEQEYIAKGITTQYAIGDTVLLHGAIPGDQIYVKLAAGAAAVTQGDFLEAAADGTLKKAASDVIPAITDSTGGTGSTTFAAIAAGASYAQADLVAIKNAISEVATLLNVLSAMGDFAPLAQAFDSMDNSGGSSEAFVRAYIL